MNLEVNPARRRRRRARHATGLALATMGGIALGRWLGVSRDTSLLVAVGTGTAEAARSPRSPA